MLIVIAIIFTSCCLLIGILESIKHKSDERYYSANEAKKVLEELYIKEDYQRIKAIVYYNDFFWTDGYEKYAEIASLQNDYESYMLAKVNFWQEKEWIMKNV